MQSFHFVVLIVRSDVLKCKCKQLQCNSEMNGHRIAEYCVFTFAAAFIFLVLRPMHGECGS